VYFLTMEELNDLLTGVARGSMGSGHSLVLETRTRVEKRKREFRLNLEVILPEQFRGRPEPMCAPLPGGERKQEKRLRGIPASPGRVTGQARRITAPVQEVKVRPGEILILPGMDPGWTPLFPAASAIVTERGGILSHGSVLAREIGIPAVTNIAYVTQTIQTGQVITVDGERGEVWL
jgi:pyruvate,water dikinase